MNKHIDRLLGMVDGLNGAGFTELALEDALRPVREAKAWLAEAKTAHQQFNDPDTKVRLSVDALMAAERHAEALKALAAAFAGMAKKAAEQHEGLREQLVPFAAEGAIVGSTHVAEYADGRGRVVVLDEAEASLELPREFFRFPKPELDKRKAGDAIKAGTRWKSVKIEPGPPTLRLTRLDETDSEETGK